MPRSTHVLPGLRFAVVGSGAVGGFYGAKLAYYGREVHFLVRSKEERAALRRFGWRVKNPKQGDFRVAKVHAHATTDAIGPCDVVLVALKATANDALPALLPPLLKPDTVLVTLQNGFGNEEFLAERFGVERVLGGLCFVCLNKTAPGVIEHFGHGAIALGEFDRWPEPRTHELAWEFKRCGVTARVAASLAAERWRKAAWNVPFNGLTILATAMRRDADSVCSVADVLADDSLTGLARGLTEEVVGAAARLGHRLPADLVDLNLRRTREMGPYRPSSLLDFLADRPLELEAIWGETYRRAFNAGAEVGRLEMLYHLLRARTASGGANGPPTKTSSS